MVGPVGEMASVKRRKLWKTGEDGLCCSSSAFQTRPGPLSLLEERGKTPPFFFFFFCVCVGGYPPKWGKRPRYIDIDRLKGQYNVLFFLIFQIYNGLLARPDWEKAIQYPVGVIPGGSGNGLARSLGHYFEYVSLFLK